MVPAKKAKGMTIKIAQERRPVDTFSYSQWIIREKYVRIKGGENIPKIDVSLWMSAENISTAKQC